MTGPGRGEGGFAVATAVLASMVVLTLSVVAVSLSVHNESASGYDRTRAQAIHAAEAGLNVATADLQAGAFFLPCTLDSDNPVPAFFGPYLSALPRGRYQVAFSYYASQADMAGNLPMACPAGGLSSLLSPYGARIRSTGSLAFGGGRLPRQMETAVLLRPAPDALNKAIFSDKSPDLDHCTSGGANSSAQVNSPTGNGADVYTNGDYCCSKTQVEGSVTAAGTEASSHGGTGLMQNSCQIDQDLLTMGAVQMNGSQNEVGHNLVSSGGGLTMDNSARVAGTATIAGVCTKSNASPCSSSQVGTLVQNHPSPPPPTYPFPHITYLAQSWSNAGYMPTTNNTCTTPTNTTQKEVAVITSGCSLSFSNNSVMTLADDYAIVTNGPVTTINNMTFRSSVPGQVRKLFIIVPWGTSCSASPQPSLTFSNNTSWTADVHFFLYTPCTIDYANNGTTASGQMYGGTVTANNNFTLTYYQTLVPGLTSGFATDILYEREVIPS